MTLTLEPTEIFLRLFAAALLGAAIGINRDLEGKPTGMRTLGLVCLGAAAITVTGVYFSGFEGDPSARGRALQGVIQGVLTGIGFLGAGAVLHRESVPVQGLTTAANVLVIAGLGIACGLGAWAVALIGGGLAFTLLVLLHPVERYLEKVAIRRAKANPKHEPPDKS